MFKLLKQALDLLPFNGDKTKITAWVTASVAALQGLGIEPAVIIEAIVQNPTKSGLIALAISLGHKVLKAKFP